MNAPVIWRAGWLVSYGLIVLGIAVQALWLSPLPWPDSLTAPVRFLLDRHDIGVYFRSSAWAVEGGRSTWTFPPNIRSRPT